VEAREDRRRVKELERELHRKDKALAKTAALLVLSKKALGGLPRRRGRMTRLEDRQNLVRDIEQACADGARLAPACALAGIDARTLRRWKVDDGLNEGDRRPDADRPIPSHALSRTGAEYRDRQRTAFRRDAAGADCPGISRRGYLHRQ
jgi:hypothetical protein